MYGEIGGGETRGYFQKSEREKGERVFAWCEGYLHHNECHHCMSLCSAVCTVYM